VLLIAVVTHLLVTSCQLISSSVILASVGGVQLHQWLVVSLSGLKD
jgi:hypothetical protein